MLDFHFWRPGPEQRPGRVPEWGQSIFDAESWLYLLWIRCLTHGGNELSYHYPTHAPPRIFGDGLIWQRPKNLKRSESSGSCGKKWRLQPTPPNGWWHSFVK